ALIDALGKREALRWKAESLPPELRRLDLEAQANERAARRGYDAAVKRGKRKEIRAAAQALDDATEAVREVAGRIQRELKQQARLFYPRAETIDTIESALEEDQALVLYGLCLDEAVALVLRHDGERIVSLAKAADITAACETFDATDLDVDPTAALGALRKLLVDRLELRVDTKRVLVSPEGPLCYLPFGALFTQPVAMTPSGTTHVLLLNEERAEGEGILALGDPDYKGASKGAQAIYYRGGTLSPLPGTRKEAEAIGTTTLLGAKASEAGLYKALPTAERWRAVHFGCHGLVNVEQPMLSSLALAREGDHDGFLTALEVLRTKIPADLAVLSACETARGKIVKGEGIVGLTRAFMFAGTPRVICSLWKVDDEATQALMVKFYELWKTQPTAIALKNAQAFVRGHEKWKHPYYWAAWQLWGLGD
ncbi:MAG: CHAT domain-containing protein, partial [Planctomycetota bacterium]|nr:CHAT domain-containing protein [Planctomycetota bacterium]